MIKTPLSTMIGGAFWTPSATIIGGASKTLDQLIKSLFANGEQGFVYDPNDLSTMFQDAAGTVPVTGAGQPVGLILDKSKNLSLGDERVVNGNFDDLSAWLTYGSPTRSVQNGVLKLEAITSTSGTYQDISLPNHSTCKVVVRARKVSGASAALINVISRAGSFDAPNSTTVEITGDSFKDYTFYFSKEANATGIRVYLQVIRNDAVMEVDSVSVKGIAGNHAYQTTSSMRPLLVASPQRLDYDIADDKLITALPAQLTGCTVIRAVPNVGTQILTGQTIQTPYNDNTDHCGLIVINRALTATETSQITKIFNKAAGV